MALRFLWNLDPWWFYTVFFGTLIGPVGCIKLNCDVPGQDVLEWRHAPQNHRMLVTEKIADIGDCACFSFPFPLKAQRKAIILALPPQILGQ